MPDESPIPQADAAECLRLIEDENAQLIDVREQLEWDEFHVRGSTHLPMSTVNDWHEDLDRERPLLLLCRSGARSQRIAEALWGQANMTNVINVAGGINAWVADGNEVERP
jgi:rhodanese-related sulfurtransferase